MNIEVDFIDGMNKEVTDPIDDAAKHDIEKAVVKICGDAEKTIQLSGNAINFVQLGPNLVLESVFFFHRKSSLMMTPTSLSSDTTSRF